MAGKLSPSQPWSSTVPAFGKLWLVDQLLSPIVRPCTRLFVSLLAVPAFRTVRRNFSSSTERDEELEKDLEQWTRGTILLFVATHNFEQWLQGFIRVVANEWLMLNTNIHWDLTFTSSSQGSVWLAAGRLMVAIGVVESMPDQQLFSVIHPGLQSLPIDRKLGIIQNVKTAWLPFLKGLACHHLSRSSPVFAILAVIFPGTTGWVCYGLAIVQYLIIGLVTSRDRALDVLSAFDRQIEIQRNKLIQEFHITAQSTPDATDELPKGV